MAPVRFFNRVKTLLHTPMIELSTHGFSPLGDHSLERKPNHLSSTRSALFVSTQHWRSCFQLGSHHIAREFAQRGWRVGFLSAPISPLHLLGLGDQNPLRIASWRSGGDVDPDTGIWHFVPFAPLSWAATPLLRNEHWVRLAWRLCSIGLKRVLQRAGFMYPEVGYTDHFLHAGLLQTARPRHTVFRLADNLAGFPGAGPDFRARQERFAREADTVICTTASSARELKTRLGLCPLLIPNGLRVEHFTTPVPPPAEYLNDKRPVAVYVGAADAWLDIDLLVEGARRLPNVRWVMIGPFEGSARERLRQVGADVLGPKSHAILPAYLQHAKVGLAPFSTTRFQSLVAEINPLKVLEYAASGLSVVAMRGCQLPAGLPTPIWVTDTPAQFLAAVEQAATAPSIRSRPTAVQFQAFGWPARLHPLFELLEQSV